MQTIQNETVLRSYKMASDRGFAPNPYGGVLTLATCKSHIRRCLTKEKSLGEWLAGFTSKGLNKKYKVSDKKLIYLARIDDILPMESYWDKYPIKRSYPSSDNIYRNVNGSLVWVPNPFHKTEKEQKDDLDGMKVIISRNYFYFGEKALSIEAFSKFSEINIPDGAACYGWLTIGRVVDALIKWVKNEAKKMATVEGQHHMFGEPHGPVVPSQDAALVASSGCLNVRSSPRGCS